MYELPRRVFIKMNSIEKRIQRQGKEQLGKSIDKYTRRHEKTLLPSDRCKLLEFRAFYRIKYGEEYKGRFA